MNVDYDKALDYLAEVIAEKVIRQVEAHFQMGQTNLAGPSGWSTRVHLFIKNLPNTHGINPHTQPIQAIKEVRGQFALGLKEAKDCVDFYKANWP